MLCSMTGFGRAEGVVGGRKVSAEVRSLNSRQLDLSLKLPALLRDRDTELRQMLGDRVVRGKCELSIALEDLNAERRTTFDRELVRAYHAELKAIADELGATGSTDLLGHVLRLPDVMTTPRAEVGAQEWEAVKALVDEALQRFETFRSDEGRRLSEELATRNANIERLLEQVDGLDDGRLPRTRQRLLDKLDELRTSVDQDRLEQELVFYLEKYELTEEKVRLRTHCAYFAETLAAEGQQGRKLGFIAQEMGREINTLGSKANDAPIQRLVVDMKDELEKIKEQVLNIL